MASETRKRILLYIFFDAFVAGEAVYDLLARALISGERLWKEFARLFVSKQ